MIPTFSASKLFYFDKVAADRPVKFAEKYLRHYEGEFAGEPFKFLDWQQEVTRTLFGWKRKADGLRRFRELYMITGKGAGKTPWLAAIGLYMLVADGEQGTQVMSCATDFPQAYLTMDSAKKYIDADDTLASICTPKLYEILHEKSKSKWSVLSGTAEGRHGFRPSCLLMDEAHEWPNGKLYNNVTANTTKRRQPLTLVATNAGANKSCFAWDLHKRALKALTPERIATTTLLPVIFEAPEDVNWTSEAAHRAANPSLGKIITFDRLAPELEKAKESPEAEARHRRLFLSQWQGEGAGHWLEIKEWDACVAKTDNEATIPDDAPLYVGIDLSQSDDLSGVALLYPTRERLFIDAHFWLPRATAERYRDKHGIPYFTWQDAGYITLVEGPTISVEVRQEIAEYVLAKHKRRPVQAVCFDPYRADQTIATLEAGGLKCVPITQGYRTSPGCYELERRIKERSTTITPNEVLRFCAENAEVERNTYGEIRVVKPDERARLAKKVDGISAIVSALVEARRHAFPAAKKQWQGSVTVV